MGLLPKLSDSSNSSEIIKGVSCLCSLPFRGFCSPITGRPRGVQRPLRLGIGYFLGRQLSPALPFRGEPGRGCGFFGEAVIPIPAHVSSPLSMSSS